MTNGVQHIREADEATIVHSLGGDLVFWESSDAEVPVELPVRLEQYLALFCWQGQIVLNVGGRSIAIPGHRMCLLRTDCVLESYSHSDDAEYCFILMSTFTMMRHIFIDDDVCKLKVFAEGHPLMTLPPKGWLLLRQYIRLLKTTGDKEHLQYDGPLIQNMVSNVIYSILNVIAYNARGQLQDYEQRPGYNLFMRFLREVSHERGKCRSVTELAGKLNVTPKHLSRVVSDVSSITPSGWLHASTLRIAYQDLKYSGMSVKEIAKDLGFPNQSAFGTFIHKYTGKSPSELRRSTLFNTSH